MSSVDIQKYMYLLSHCGLHIKQNNIYIKYKRIPTDWWQSCRAGTELVIMPSVYLIGNGFHAPV